VLAATARTEENLAAALSEVSSRIRGITDKLNGRSAPELN